MSGLWGRWGQQHRWGAYVAAWLVLASYGAASPMMARGFAQEPAHLPELSALTLQSDRLFEPHGCAFKAQAGAYLSKALRALRQADPQLHVYVSAYADDIVSVLERRRVTEAQAESVAHYLWSQGIAYERIHIRGMGSDGLLGNVHYVASNALNRRVELVWVPSPLPHQLYPFKD